MIRVQVNKAPRVSQLWRLEWFVRLRRGVNEVGVDLRALVSEPNGSDSRVRTTGIFTSNVRLILGVTDKI